MQNANQQINLQLTVDEINIILNTLGQMPYVQVAAIIGKISKQAESQWKETDDNTNA